jgi:HEAT repeat protein
MTRLYLTLVFQALLSGGNLIAEDTAAFHDAPNRSLNLTEADIPSDLKPEVKHLLAQTFSADVRERIAAARMLAKEHEYAALVVPFLIRLLDDPDPDKSEPFNNDPYYAYDVLLELGEPALDAVVQAASDPSSMVQTYAIDCLNKFESLRAADALVRLLDSSDTNTRHFAAECFKTRHDPRSVGPLLAMLKALHGLQNGAGPCQ